MLLNCTGYVALNGVTMNNGMQKA